MRRAAVTVLAALVAGCGGGGAAATVAPAGKVVAGETETGMELKVETFVAPDSDPTLKRLDAYRAAGGYPAVDYHRVSANNADGAVPDRIRTVTFARTPASITTGKGIQARFVCDALTYEWVPQDGEQRTYAALRKTLCAVPPSEPEGIQPGQRTVYYLITDRTFAERGIRGLSVFGPRDVEFEPRSG
jgi:hypothetical protein